MEKKYPVLKCDKKLWEEIKPVLESFGINDFIISESVWEGNSYIVSNFGNPFLNNFKIGNTTYSEDEVINNYLRYLVSTKETFLYAVYRLLDKTSKNNKHMEKINIAEKLKHCKKGTKLYCILYGEVEFDCIDEDGDIQIIVKDKDDDPCYQYITLNGLYSKDFPNGECLLFPSKDNRDWNTFKVLEEGHRVMVSSNGIDWYLHMYSSDNNSRYFSSDDDTEWLYIVPVEDFDFNAKDISVNIKKSIV